MILEGLVSFLGGAITRFVPLWFTAKEKKDERLHEREMLRLNIEVETLRTKGRAELAKVEGEMAIGAGEIQALIEATKAQGVPSGSSRIDALNKSIRPILTLWWCIFLYTAVIAARFYLLVSADVPAAEAIVQLWGSFETSIVGSIIGFWFVNRELAKRGLGS